MAKLLKKVYTRIFWKNEEDSKTTPLGKSNLNKEDEALEIIDERVCALSNDKAEVSEIQDSIIYYDIEPNSGNITVRTRGGGEKIFYIYQLIPRLAAVKAEADRAEDMANTATNQAGIATDAAYKANQYMQNAANSAAAAKVSETNAKDSEKEAKASENLVVPVKPIAEEAIKAAENIKDVESNVQAMVDKLLDEITGTFVGALTSKGTITFQNLPTSNIQVGTMYNISNDFVTDGRFVEGAGKEYKAGSNVYWTVDGKWDVLAAPSFAKILESSGTRAPSETSAGDNLKIYIDSYDQFDLLISSGGLKRMSLNGFVTRSTDINKNYPRLTIRMNNGFDGNTENFRIPVYDSNKILADNLSFKGLYLWDGIRRRRVMQAFDDGDNNDYGSDLVVTGAGNTFIGGGEAPENLRSALINGTPPYSLTFERAGESLFLVSDGELVLISNYQDPANSFCIYLNNRDSCFAPGDGQDNRIQLGLSNVRWSNVWTHGINNFSVRISGETGRNPWFGRIAQIEQDGVLEIGRYIDFHHDLYSTYDYEMRLECTNPGYMYLHSGAGRAYFQVHGNSGSESSDIAVKNDARGTYITLSCEGSSKIRGLWDNNKQYWCYIDDNDKAWLKGTADKAITDSYGWEFKDRFLKKMDQVYIIGSASETISLQQYTFKGSSSFTWVDSTTWLLIITAYTSSGSVYGRTFRVIDGLGTGNVPTNIPTALNVHTTNNTGFTLSYDLYGANNLPRITITGTSSRTIIAEIVQI